MKHGLWFLTCFVVTLLVMAIGVRSSYAVTVTESKDASTTVKFLLQVQAQAEQNATYNGKGWAGDFFVRRARIILFGNVTPYVNYFVETDEPDYGKRGNNNPSFFIQDAYITLHLYKDEVKLDTGMLLLPFSHNGREAASTLLPVDYDISSVFGRYPAEGSQNVVGRVFGAELSGFLIKGHLNYIALVSNGENAQASKITTSTAVLNPNDTKRFTGRLQYNVFDTDDVLGFFYAGTYLGAKRILSVGASYDEQPDSISDDPSNVNFTKVGNYSAYDVDVFLDYPIAWPSIASGVLTVQAAYLNYNYDKLNYNDGAAWYAEIGYLLPWVVGWGRLEPVIKIDSFTSSQTPANGTYLDFARYHFGVNYWLKEHEANIKAEYLVDSENGKINGTNAQGLDAATVQFQILL